MEEKKPWHQQNILIDIKGTLPSAIPIKYCWRQYGAYFSLHCFAFRILKRITYNWLHLRVICWGGKQQDADSHQDCRHEVWSWQPHSSPADRPGWLPTGSQELPLPRGPPLPALGSPCTPVSEYCISMQWVRVGNVTPACIFSLEAEHMASQTLQTAEGNTDITKKGPSANAGLIILIRN